MEKNWIVIYYDIDGKDLGFITIKNKTYTDANIEASYESNFITDCNSYEITETK